MSNLEGFRNRSDFSAIASLNKKVYVWGDVPYINELGEEDVNPGLIKVNPIWASLIPQTGSLQKQQGETILSNVTHKIKIRYSSGKDITQDMWIIFQGHRFDIKYILNPYFSNEFLELFCEEVIE
jgi:SPP1 family predicted phage head-tail adaptor